MPIKRKYTDLRGESQYRAFRHGLTILKAKGLLSPSVDPRTARPYGEVRRVYEDNQDVILGNASVWKVKPSKAKGLKLLGYRIERNHIILPKSADLYGYVAGGEVYEVRKTASNRKTKTKVKVPETTRKGRKRSFIDFEEFINELEHDPKFKLTPGEALGFYIGDNGAQSLATFQTFDQMRKYLLRYEPLIDPISNQKRAEAFIKALTVVKTIPYDWDTERRNKVFKLVGRRKPKKRKKRAYVKRKLSAGQKARKQEYNKAYMRSKRGGRKFK